MADELTRQDDQYFRKYDVIVHALQPIALAFLQVVTDGEHHR